MGQTKIVIRWNNIPKIRAQSADKLDDALEELAREGERIVKQSFGTGPAGRPYTRRGIVHIASAVPGPPAVDTGTLRNSINVSKPRRLRRLIRDGVGYGVLLEYGTYKMGARPFMRPMAHELLKEVPRIFTNFHR